jgi:hypothetical protein
MLPVIMAEELAAIDPDRLRIIGDSPDAFVVDQRVAIVSAAIGAGLMIAWYKCHRWLADAREQNREVTGGQSVAATRDMADSGSYPKESAFSMRADVPRGNNGQDNGNPGRDGSLDYRLSSDTDATMPGLSREEFSVTAYW